MVICCVFVFLIALLGNDQQRVRSGCQVTSDDFFIRCSHHYQTHSIKSKTFNLNAKVEIGLKSSNLLLLLCFVTVSYNQLASEVTSSVKKTSESNWTEFYLEASE